MSTDKIFELWLQARYPKGGAAKSYLKSIQIISKYIYNSTLSETVSLYLSDPESFRDQTTHKLKAVEFQERYINLGLAPSLLKKGFLSAANSALYAFSKLKPSFNNPLAESLKIVQRDFPRLPWQEEDITTGHQSVKALKRIVSEFHCLFEAKDPSLFTALEGGGELFYSEYLTGTGRLASEAEFNYLFKVNSNGKKPTRKLGIYPLIRVCDFSGDKSHKILLRLAKGTEGFNALSKDRQDAFKAFYDEIYLKVCERIRVDFRQSVTFLAKETPKKNLKQVTLSYIYSYDQTELSNIDEDLYNLLKITKDVFIEVDYQKKLDDFLAGNTDSSEQIKGLSTNKKSINLGKSLILSGPPGTGKSYKLNQKLSEHEINPKDPNGKMYRVICHPELTNAQFIGTYRPNMEAKKNLTYSFTPGPFIKLLHRALRYSDQPHILIIEELNRTNAAAMFAEAFQLLDRDEDGWSEYSTDLGDDVIEYLLNDEDDSEQTLSEDVHEELQAGVKLPPNFAIWATMNTADQGVFPMDTAFKRRWSFEYLGVDEGQEIWSKEPWNPVIPKQGGLTWQALRQQINALLNTQGVDEDRQLGGFFLNQAELSDSDKLLEHIVNKVIGYLRDDVMRYEPEKLFKADASSARAPSFSQLRRSLLNSNTSTNLLSIFASSDDQELSINKVMEDFDAERIEQETSQKPLSTYPSENETLESDSLNSDNDQS